MGSDTFTGIVKFRCNKNNKHITIYTIIERQCPENYKSLDHFKKFHDLSNLKWTKKINKVKQSAKKKEDNSPTHHGIINIDYTNFEPLEFQIMYSNQFKQLVTTQTVIYNTYNYIIYLIYIVFMLKLLSNLYY
jgi:hypothetical protein